jgi:hypothetical protein
MIYKKKRNENITILDALDTFFPLVLHLGLLSLKLFNPNEELANWHGNSPL